MGFLAVVCGLKSEAAVVARAVDGARVRIGVSGANAARAEEIARGFCNDGAAAIISIGLSGGLDPGMKPGDLVIGETVIAGDGSVYESDGLLLKAIASSFETISHPHPEVRARRASLEESAGGAAPGGRSFEAFAPQKRLRMRGEPAAKGASRDEVIAGRLFGGDEIVDSAEKKAALFRTHAAIAVDMESHGVARAAAAAKIPFLAIRAVADPAERALPKAALNAIAPDGSTRIMATLAAAMADPKQFAELMKLGADSRAALKTLRRDLGPLFGRLFLSLDL